MIPAGYVGVYDLFGEVAEQSMAPGIHLVNPLASIHKLAVRTQEVKETADIPTREGLNVNMDVSLLFRLNGVRAAEVFRGIGPEYVKVVVVPQLRAIVRNTTSGYDAKALYTAERGILGETILLRKIILPPKLAGAIESKLEAEQMRYVLDKEKQVAERKRIEAQGIADYRVIIHQGLNDDLLRWKGIEATRELARSQNAKVVVIGAGKEGLPLILGNP
ncbi:MAG: prohibitin family protein [Desulfobacterales bacterium]|nr:prohibitin family protein [Desulfobacterales bacterium]